MLERPQPTQPNEAEEGEARAQAVALEVYNQLKTGDPSYDINTETGLFRLRRMLVYAERDLERAHAQFKGRPSPSDGAVEAEVAQSFEYELDRAFGVVQQIKRRIDALSPQRPRRNPFS